MCAHVLSLMQTTAAAPASSTRRAPRGPRGVVSEQIRPPGLRSHMDVPTKARWALWSVSGPRGCALRRGLVSPRTGGRERALSPLGTEVSAEELAPQAPTTSRRPQSSKRFLVTPMILLVAMVTHTQEHLPDVLSRPPGSRSVTPTFLPLPAQEQGAARERLRLQRVGRVFRREAVLLGGRRAGERTCQASSDKPQAHVSVHRSPAWGLLGPATGKGSCSSCHSTLERHLSHFHVALGEDINKNRRFDARPLTEKPWAHGALQRGFRSLPPPPSSHFLFPFGQKEHWEVTGTGHQAQHFLVVPQSI